MAAYHEAQLLQLSARRLSHLRASSSGTCSWQHGLAGRHAGSLAQYVGGAAAGFWRAFSSEAGQAVGTAVLAGARVASHASRAPPTLQRRVRSLLRDLKQLSKARLSALVVMTASAGFVAGSGEQIDWRGLAWTSIGTFGAAACANTLNQVYETANDQRMSRTCNRPLPAGRMGRGGALLFATLAGAAGLYVLAEQTNSLTAGLGAANIALYAAAYTPLKQISVVNTWLGAVVGAIPPLMGWAAAAGQLEPGAWVLAAALFSWQMPHFMALAWMCKDDYARGGFRMLSLRDRSGRRTAGVALRHCAYLLPVGAAAAALGVASWWFAAEAATLACVMGAGAAAFYARPSQQSARKLFRGSLVYLPLLMAGLVAHRHPNTGELRTLADVRSKLERDFGISLALPSLPQVRMRSLEERLGPMYPGLRCPSRVYADDGDRGPASSADASTHAASAGDTAAVLTQDAAAQQPRQQ